MDKLTITEFGNPVLREKAKELLQEKIKMPETQDLILGMRDLLISKKMGVGLAAPQVGQSIQLAVVAIRPSKRRPKAEPVDLVLINPRVTEAFGRRRQLYEGCISGGPGKGGLFALVPRYKKLKLAYLDEAGNKQHKIFSGLTAHVIQHEIDHLNGVLFVDKVKDTNSYKTYKEYLKYAKEQSRLAKEKKRSLKP
jgi:peptide deformylase